MHSQTIALSNERRMIFIIHFIFIKHHWFIVACMYISLHTRFWAHMHEQAWMYFTIRLSAIETFCSTIILYHNDYNLFAQWSIKTVYSKYHKHSRVKWFWILTILGSLMLNPILYSRLFLVKIQAFRCYNFTTTLVATSFTVFSLLPLPRGKLYFLGPFERAY